MQQQRMSMGKKKFRIGDLAKELKIKKFVVRFWEKEFDLKSDRSDGGQRFYTEIDLETFSAIKKLLYDDGFTIAGAKKHLEIKKPMHKKTFETPKEISEAEKASTPIAAAFQDSVVTQPFDIEPVDIVNDPKNEASAGKLIEMTPQNCKKDLLEHSEETAHQKVSPAHVTQTFNNDQIKNLTCELEKTKDQYKTVVIELKKIKSLLVDFKEQL